jgi:DHA3 family tetracycline resistance protein-like MFS transporter
VLSSLFDRRQRNNPVPVYLTLMAWQATCHALFFTVQLVYHVTVVGLDPFQMVLVGAVLEITCVLFEAPTGVVADVYSRRLSILIGAALMGCSYILEGGIPEFWAALVSQIFWGVGFAFISGANHAWIADEIGDERAGPIFLRGRQTWLAGILTGTLLSVAIALIHIQAPMILAGLGMFALAAMLSLVMPETPRRAATAGALTALGRVKSTTLEGFRLARTSPVVKTIIAISLFTGLAAEAWDRLYVPSMIQRFAFPTVLGSSSPVIWFGLSGVVGTLLALAASELFRRRSPAALGVGTPARLLATCSAIQVVALVVFVVSGSFWLSLSMIWARIMVSSVSIPVELAWLNRNLDSSTRATVISLTSQANSFGQATGGPALGWIGSVVSIRAALLGSAIVLSPAIALYRRLIVRDRAAPESFPNLAD